MLCWSLIYSHSERNMQDGTLLGHAENDESGIAFHLWKSLSSSSVKKEASGGLAMWDLEGLGYIL